MLAPQTMSRRRRSRQRQRFTPRPAPPPAERVERDYGAASREAIRPRFSRPGTIGRAIGQPSAALLRAATLEYGFVVKDLRRIGLVAGGSLAILALAALAANALLK